MADDTIERARAYWQSLATAERQEAAKAKDAVKAEQIAEAEQQRDKLRLQHTLTSHL
jgi:hypothetical protein